MRDFSQWHVNRAIKKNDSDNSVKNDLSATSTERILLFLNTININSVLDKKQN